MYRVISSSRSRSRARVLERRVVAALGDEHCQDVQIASPASCMNRFNTPFVVRRCGDHGLFMQQLEGSRHQLTILFDALPYLNDRSTAEEQFQIVA